MARRSSRSPTRAQASRPAKLERIFDPFLPGTAARARETGFGLGLALARRIVEAHGAAIRASNVPGGGARIEMRLPAA